MEFWATEHAKIASAVTDQLAMRARLDAADDNARAGLVHGVNDLGEREERRHSLGTATGLLIGTPLGALAGGVLGDSAGAALGGGFAGMLGGAAIGNGLSRIGDGRRFDDGLSGIMSRIPQADDAFARHPLATRFGTDPNGNREKWDAALVSGPLDKQKVQPIPMSIYHSTPHVLGDPFVDYIAGRRPNLPEDHEVLNTDGHEGKTTMLAYHARENV